MLVSRGDERLVVRVHRPSVSPARLEAIDHARQHLDAAGVPCSALLVASDGTRWARAAGRLVEAKGIGEYRQKLVADFQLDVVPASTRPSYDRVRTIYACGILCMTGTPSRRPSPAVVEHAQRDRFLPFYDGTVMFLDGTVTSTLS
jgi:hypothetical protein